MKKNSTPTEIKMEFKSRGQDERKGGAGILSSLLSKLGLGGSGSGAGGAALGGTATIGAGGSSGGLLGGAGLGTGVLASKMGIVMMVLAGTTIAAGLGVFNQGGFLSMPSSSYAPDERLQAFNQASQKTESSNAAGSVEIQKADGSVSPSLQYVNQANSGQLADPNAAASPASASATPPPDNSNSAPNATLASARKMVATPGFQNSATSAGSGARLSPSGMATGIGGDFASIYNPNANAGSIGSSRRPGAVVARAGKTAVIGKAGSALGQARAAKGVLQSNLGSKMVSSAGSGTTYDGGGNAGLIGGGPGAITGGGIGTGGAGMTSANPSANPPANPKEVLAPDPGTGKDVTPWKNAVKTATTALLTALGLLLLAEALSAFQVTQWWGMMVAKLAAVAALVAVVEGIMIIVRWGQYMQGSLFVVLGGFILAASAKVGIGNEPLSTEKGFKGLLQGFGNIFKNLLGTWSTPTPPASS